MTNGPGLPGQGADASSDPARPLGSKGTILLVEDEANVRILVAKVLVQQGYTVIEASNGAEALDRALGCSQPIDLLVSDVSMPQLSGPELVREVLARRPGMRVLFVTGRDKIEVPQGAGLSYLEKPFTLKGLVARVRQVLS